MQKRPRIMVPNQPLSAEQVASLLGVSLSTAYRRKERGVIDFTTSSVRDVLTSKKPKGKPRGRPFGRR